jgi:hypothetical protein
VWPHGEVVGRQRAVPQCLPIDFVAQEGRRKPRGVQLGNPNGTPALKEKQIGNKLVLGKLSFVFLLTL